MKAPIFLIAVLMLGFTAHAPAGAEPWRYPQARAEPSEITMFGTTLSDPYFWMNRPENREEMEAFARAQDELFKEAMARVPGTDDIQREVGTAWDGFPVEWGYANLIVRDGHAIYMGGDEKGTAWFREPLDGGPKERLLEMRHEIDGRTWSVRGMRWAHEKPWVALMLVERGDANPHIRIWDYAAQQFLPDSLGPVMFNSGRGVSMAWLPGDDVLLYSQTPEGQEGVETYFNGRIVLHRIGTPQSEDVPVFGRGVNPDIHLEAFETPFIGSHAGSNLITVYINHGLEPPYAYYVDSRQLDGSRTPWQRIPGSIHDVHADADDLYVVTAEHPHYVLKRLDPSGDGSSTTLLEGQEFPLISESLVITDTHALILGRKVQDRVIYRVNLDGSGHDTLQLPGSGNIDAFERVNDQQVLLTQYSATEDIQPWILDVATAAFQRWPAAYERPVFGHLIESRVIEVPSRDGVLIPVTLVYKAGTDLHAQNRIWLGVYGSAGASFDVYPMLDYMPWFERDGIYAWAHVRGGGDKGEDWIRGGSIPYVGNRINDFIDVSRYLIDEEYTTPGRLVVDGRSAGTFAIGMAVNREPELYAAAFYQVGVPDDVTEWSSASYRHGGRHEGLPLDAESFRHTLAISSVYNIPEGRELPAMLVTNGATDYAIPLHTGTRYVARLQQAQAGSRPIFQSVAWDVGHGQIVSLPDMFRFALWQTGHPDFQPGE